MVAYLALGLGTEGGGRAFGFVPPEVEELRLWDMVEIELMKAVQTKAALLSFIPRGQIVAQLGNSVHLTVAM